MKFHFPIVILQIFFILIITNFTFSQSKGGRWQFENNGNDSAEWDALDDSGTLMANAYYDNSELVNEGTYCLNIKGDGSHIKINDSEDLDFNNENIGISAWIYPSAIEGNVHFILNKGQQNSNPKTTNYALRIAKSSKLEFLIRNSNNQAKPVASSFVIQPNEWTFIAAYYDYTLKKVYFWNQQASNPVDTVDYNHDYFDNADPLTIGGWYTSDPEKPLSTPFKGKIDDVRIGTTIEEVMAPQVNIHPENREFQYPTRFSLNQNYPNPFNPKTVISWELLQTEYVSLDIYNILGNKIATLVNERMDPGNYQFVFDASIFPSGIYIYRMNAGSSSEARKMIISK